MQVNLTYQHAKALLATAQWYQQRQGAAKDIALDAAIKALDIALHVSTTFDACKSGRRWLQALIVALVCVSAVVPAYACGGGHGAGHHYGKGKGR